MSTSFDPLARRLVESSYLDRRLFLARQRPKYPHFLYKFKALRTDSVSLGHLSDLIVEGRLWLSSPQAFNDPFDMTAHIKLEGTTDQIRTRVKQIIDETGKAQGLNWKQRRAKVDSYMARNRAEWTAALKKSHSQFAASTGVFSFAGDPKSVLMWSHYGDHHTGICLQFEIARDPKTLLQAVSVNYVTDYPVFNWALPTKDQVLPFLLHKYRAWSYELERRIIWPDGANTYLPFNPASLTGIIFGCRANEDAIQQAQTLIAERAKLGLPALRQYQAVMHENKYALRIKKL